MSNSSEPILAFTDFDECDGVVWETSKGKVITVKGNFNPQRNLNIKDVKTGEEVDDVDWRNILSDILFR